jgi:transglutaminase-like putative cysteine protease
MKLHIKKQTTYSYAGKVSFSPHLIRIFPRVDLFLKVENIHFETDSTADIQYRRDLYDNLVAHCFYPNAADKLTFNTELDLTVQERNPFHFLLDSHALHIPCQYKDAEISALQPYLKPEENTSLPSPLAPSAPRPTVETLVNINSWIFENITYERRHDDQHLAASQILKSGSGSCRDFSALLTEALRQNGVATRLASGFVWEGDKADADKRASSAMHAWVEAYLPGAGWIGLDPTNGVLCDHHFVTTAVGCRHTDIAPVSGSYYSSAPVASELTTKLSVEKVA